MIPLTINGKDLHDIMVPGGTGDESLVLPTSVTLTSETYSRNAERTADYELMELTIVNRKAKPEFTWELIPAEYVARLMAELNYDYNFISNDVVVPREAEPITVTYRDFTGMRTINAYLGQTIDGTLVEYDGVSYWQNFRIAFPER